MFRTKYGDHGAELDAVPLDRLRKVLKEWLAGVIKYEVYVKVLEREEAEQEQIREALKSLGTGEDEDEEDADKDEEDEAADDELRAVADAALQAYIDAKYGDPLAADDEIARLLDAWVAADDRASEDGQA